MKLVISGSAGCGKSTLAQALSHRFGCALVPEMYEGLAGHRNAGRAGSSTPEMAAARFVAVLEAKLARQAEHAQCIVDRSPLDLFNLWLHSGLGQLEAASADFHARCLKVMLDYDRVVVPPWNALPLVADPQAPMQRRRNRWVQLTNHAAILGLTQLAVPAEKLLLLPPALPPAHWADWVADRVTRDRR